jgi:hypothetical protein
MVDHETTWLLLVFLGLLGLQVIFLFLIRRNKLSYMLFFNNGLGPERSYRVKGLLVFFVNPI